MAAIRIGQLSNKTVVNDDSSVHLLPCNIKHSGEANVAVYFQMSTDDEQLNSKRSSDIKTASFRGRPLKGQNVQLPTGYQGLVLKEEKKPYTDEEDRTLLPQMAFKEFSYWNLETQPSENDNIVKALKWLGISQAIHERTEILSEQTQTDR